MCVVCGGKIDLDVDALHDQVGFVCREHGAYVVAKAVLLRLAHADTKIHRGALEKARVFAPQRGGEVVITAMDL